MPEHVRFEEVDEATWNEAAPPKQGKVSPWDGLVETLESGKPLRVPVSSEKELRGARIGIARRARSRGYSVTFRVSEGALLVRTSQEEPRARRTRSQSSPTPGTDGQPRRRGRPPKQRPIETP
jgi:hypothetical protein